MSFKHNIFRALRLYYTSALQDFLKVMLGGESAFVRTPACIEGARMALARGKTYWAEMDATAVASRGSDKSRFPTEHYFEEVLQGARLIESQCSKDVMFE